jgi:hypothetical protein
MRGGSRRVRGRFEKATAAGNLVHAIRPIVKLRGDGGRESGGMAVPALILLRLATDARPCQT